MDYGHKDAAGKAIRTDEKNYNAFKTRKGRAVYDGGGISPDIAMEETKLSPIAQNLQQNDAIFNCATDYFYRNPSLGEKIPTLTDADYAIFKQFLKKENVALDTETQKALKKAFELAQKEGIDESIKTEYNQLTAAVNKSEEMQINKHQKEIKNLMVDELILRYQYRDGLYNYYLKSNAEIKKAASILNNPTEYKKILLQ